MRWLHFDEMSWPMPQDVAALSWALTYGTPTKEELLAAASVVSAYGALILTKNTKERNHIVKTLRGGKQ